MANIKKTKTEEGFKVWDTDNQKYLLDGTAFDIRDAAIYFLSDWLKIHAEKYNEQSKFEIHKGDNSVTA